MAFWQAFVKPKLDEDQMRENDFISHHLYLAEDIRYHIQNLLSSQLPLIDLNEQFYFVKSSNFNFGIQNNVRLEDEKGALTKIIQQQLIRFEKRISHIKVNITSREMSLTALSVTGKIIDDDELLEVSFDSNLGLNDLLVKKLDGSFNE